MFLNNSFGKNLDILQRTMDVSTIRQDVIANNIANADTPNFKRTVVNFEAQLKRALDSENSRKMPAAMTNERHIPLINLWIIGMLDPDVYLIICLRQIITGIMWIRSRKACSFFRIS